MNQVVREQENGELQERLASLALHIIPALFSYGIGFVEVAYKAGDEITILGLQFRDPKGLRIGRGTVPLRVVASLEGWATSFARNVGAGEGDGVVELNLADRKGVCKLQQSGDDAVSIIEWVW